MHVNIRSINISSEDGIFEGEITLFVHNVTFLNSLNEKITKLTELKKLKELINTFNFLIISTYKLLSVWVFCLFLRLVKNNDKKRITY